MIEMASKVRIDAFTRVKKAIDDMVTQLLKEKEDEIKHKDFCVSGLNENVKQTESTDRDKTDVETTIEDLTMTIDTITKEVETLKSEIAELQVQLKRAGEDREIENKEFQGTVADQRATQKLLQQAMAVLKSFYDKKAEALVQKGKKQEPAGPPPPPGFKAYEKSEAAGGVMGMIQQIINDAKAMEAEAIKAEEDAQKSYEDFVKETNRSIDEKSTGITNKQEVELGDRWTEEANCGWHAMMNYCGGAMMFIKSNYAEQLHILGESWATVNSKCGSKGKTALSSVDEDTDEEHDKKDSGAVPTSFDEMLHF